MNNSKRFLLSTIIMLSSFSMIKTKINLEEEVSTIILEVLKNCGKNHEEYIKQVRNFEKFVPHLTANKAQMIFNTHKKEFDDLFQKCSYLSYNLDKTNNENLSDCHQLEKVYNENLEYLKTWIQDGNGDLPISYLLTTVPE
jgi:hypothetical protein